MKVRPSNTSVMEGAVAVAKAVQAARPQVISAYPITPQTHIIESLAQMVADGELDAEYIRADSEFSAASICCGASATGVRSYTASGSQGLALMAEVIFNIAGMRLPVVLTGANRMLSAPISLQPDYNDAMLLRDSGVIELYVESAQEAYDAHLQAFKIAEDHDVLLPALVCLDGYVLTHVFEPVRTLAQADVDEFLPPYEPLHLVDPAHPTVFGCYSDETNSTEARYIQYQASMRAKAVIERVADEYRERFGLYHGGLIDTYRMEDAEIALVAMGSTVSTLRVAVDELRSAGERVGLIKIRAFRPFPVEALRRAVRGVRIVAALDKAISMGMGGILAYEVRAALYNTNERPLVMGFMAGYGGREVTPEMAGEIVERSRRALADGVPPDEPIFTSLCREILPEGVR